MAKHPPLPNTRSERVAPTSEDEPVVEGESAKGDPGLDCQRMMVSWPRTPAEKTPRAARPKEPNRFISPESQVRDRGDFMIVVTTDTVPGATIVRTLGAVEAKSSLLSWNQEGSAKHRLEGEASRMGANAIVAYRVVRTSFGNVSAYGTAVIIQY